MVSTMLSSEFFCGLRGFRVYCAKCKPRVADKNMIFYEKGNPHDENAMAGTKTLPGTLAPSIIRHVPKDISPFTRYIADHGATISAFFILSNHRRSPLIQCGREIPIKLVMKLPVGAETYSNLEKYKQLSREFTRNQLTESTRMQQKEY